MSPVLPFDIAALIIDIAGENNDTDLLKELALVSHSFLQICSKYLFATVELHDADPMNHVESSKEGFVKLLKSRPDVVKHIRKLIYCLGINDRFHLLPTYSSLVNSSILPNLLRTIPHPNYLQIGGPSDWNKLNPSLISALLHLMHLPTINHIDLSFIRNFPLSSLTLSVNLLRLDISNMDYFDEEDYAPEIVRWEMMPKIREFHTSESSLPTSKLLRAKMHDRQPAFNLMDLRRLSMSFDRHDDRNLRYLLRNAKLLEKLRLSAGRSQSLVGLLSLSARTLKVLDLTVFLKNHLSHPPPSPLAGLCEELEAMAGHNVLEVLSFEVLVDLRDREDFIGSMIQKIEEVLVKPGWSVLRQVSLKVTCLSTVWSINYTKFSEALQYLPDKYLSHLPKLESVAFNYSTTTHF